MKRQTGQLLIGELAKGAGVKPDTVRFYERNGLLSKPERTTAGYRVYDKAALQRLRFIKKAQALGFSLDEVRRILSLRGCGSETCRSVIAIAEATLSETETKLKELQHFRDALARNLTRWKENAKPKAAAEFCALIESSASLAADSSRQIEKGRREVKRHSTKRR
jgi:MerR family mercuric resistance operon transcriptional regulator